MLEENHSTLTPVSEDNILHTRGGATTFIKQRIDNAKDVFFELLGQETI